MIRRPHRELHAVHRIGWLRAAVMGANDGLISTSSVVVGVAAADAGAGAILAAGTAGLVAGAMSMAAGEYVSVSSQADAEAADIAREAEELREMTEAELNELAAIYRARGLNVALARQVAEALTARDALAAHARDELGITDITAARPLQAAVVSALTFSAGAIVPVGVAIAAPAGSTALAVSAAALVALAVLGALGAAAGGAGVVHGAFRVVLWGALAMAATAAVGALVGAHV